MRGLLLTVLIMAAIVGAGYLSYQFFGSSAFPGAAISTFKNNLLEESGEKSTSTLVELFYVKLDDNGVGGKKIGCNDSVIGIETSVPKTETPLRSAMEALVNQKVVATSTGLYDALSMSRFSVRDVSIQNQTAIINLSGTLRLGGVCDAPRIQAQLEETARQFPSVKTAAVFVNGIELSKLLSQQ